MLLEAVKAAGIGNVKEDDFYLTLLKDGHVHITVLSIVTLWLIDIFFSQNRFSG